MSKGASQKASIDSVGVIFLLNVSVVGRTDVKRARSRVWAQNRFHTEYKNCMRRCQLSEQPSCLVVQHVRKSSWTKKMFWLLQCRHKSLQFLNCKAPIKSVGLRVDRVKGRCIRCHNSANLTFLRRSSQRGEKKGQNNNAQHFKDEWEITQIPQYSEMPMNTVSLNLKQWLGRKCIFIFGDDPDTLVVRLPVQKSHRLLSQSICLSVSFSWPDGRNMFTLRVKEWINIEKTKSMHVCTNTQTQDNSDTKIYNLNPLLKGKRTTPLLSQGLNHMHSWPVCYRYGRRLSQQPRIRQ